MATTDWKTVILKLCKRPADFFAIGLILPEILNTEIGATETQNWFFSEHMVLMTLYIPDNASSTDNEEQKEGKKSYLRWKGRVFLLKRLKV